MKPRVAWISGGGTGIGRALTNALYRTGWWVVISGRREAVLTQAAQEIVAAHKLGDQSVKPGDIWAVPGDLGSPPVVAQISRALHERWGDVDLLINNAGVNPYHAFMEATPEEFEQTFRSNCLSAILCTQAVLPGMLARKSGAIVNISSILGRWASPTSTAYSVSKYALAGLTDSLRQEITGSGVHVMGVYPGFIRTPMTLPYVGPDSPRQRFGKSPEAMAAAILKGLKQGRREVLYPWYVPLVLRLHQWFPRTLESLRKIFGR
jgi:short-subunit dehydrogenase